MDSDEDNDITRSWISFKSLKKAADVKEFFQHKPSPSVGGYGSINSESLANPAIHSSLSFSNVHRKYREEDKREDTGQEVEQARVLLSSLQAQLQSQEMLWRQRFLSLETLIRENERRISLKSPLDDFSLGSLSSFLPLSERVRTTDHSACRSEIENMRQTISRQKKVIEGLEGTIATLRGKLEQLQGTKTRRKHNLSSM